MKRKLFSRTAIFFAILLAPLVVLEVLLRQPHLDEIGAKRTLLERAAKNGCHTVAVGSSLAYTGLNPAQMGGGLINLANTNQTYYYNFRIVEKCLATLPQLKTVLLSLEYPIFFCQPVEQQERQYRIFWGIPNLNTKPAIDDYSMVLALGLGNGLERLFKGENFDKNEGWMKNNTRFDGSPTLLKKRIDLIHSHMDTAHFNDNAHWLWETIRLCHQQQVRLVMFIAPLGKGMRTALSDDKPFRPRFDALLDSLRSEAGVELIDFNENPAYPDILYRDGDHLNESGAGIFSEQFRAVLKKNAETVITKNQSPN